MRVWHEYLSERDLEHLSRGWEKQEPFGLGRRAALLIIDMWEQSIGLERRELLDAMETMPGHCGVEGWDALEPTRALLDLARDRGLFVVHTTVEDPIPTGMFPATAGSIGKPAFSFHPACDPAPGELIVRKPHASSFQGTSLAAHLTARGIDTVIVCGNSTSGCVRASVVDGAAAGFRVGVVEECVFDRTQASHAINLFDMDQKYADVITIEAALSYFRDIAEVSDLREPVRLAGAGH